MEVEEQEKPDNGTRSEWLEKVVLSNSMHNDSCFIETVSLLTENDFTTEENKLAAAAMLEAAAAGKRTFDPVEMKGILPDEYILELAGYDRMISSHGKIITRLQDMTTRRRLVNLGWQIGSMSAECKTGAELATKISKEIEAVTTQKAVASIKTAHEAYIDSQRVDLRPGVTTGIDRVDRITGGMKRGQVTVLAARPGMGKTAIGIQSALSAGRNGHKVMFVSLEMGAGEISQRMIANLSHVSCTEIANRTWAGQDNEAIDYAKGLLSGYDIRIDDNSHGLERIINSIRLHSVRHGVDFLVIDYIGLIQNDKGRFNKNAEVSESSRTIKLLTRELNCATLVLSQLNREASGDSEPSLKNLRDSGAVEQDADKVILAWAKDEKMTNEDGETDPVINVWVKIAKNRQGGTGKTRCVFNRPIMQYRSLRQGEEW